MILAPKLKVAQATCIANLRVVKHARKVSYSRNHFKSAQYDAKEHHASSG